MKKIDVLAIGDVVTDAFIKIPEARLVKGGEQTELCLTYGDKIPYESVDVIPAVGNSANASVACARLGLSSSLISDIGDDANGKECLAALSKENVGVDLITSHAGIKTNYHYVLWYKNDRTILVKHESFPYSLPKAIESVSPSWIYLSSLGESSLEYHKEIAKYIAEHPEVKLAFQPGTFQMKIGTQALSDIYSHTEIFFCNVEEAERILGVPGEPLSLMRGLRALGPRIVVVTDGPNGSYALEGADEKGLGGTAYFLPEYPDQKPALERTGAGDSYASTLTSALIKGKSLTEAMKWGSVNAMSVVQEVGAQKGLLTEEAILSYLAKAPAGWDIKNI